MKIDLQGYSHLDYDVSVWETLLAIYATKVLKIRNSVSSKTALMVLKLIKLGKANENYFSEQQYENNIDILIDAKLLTKQGDNLVLNAVDIRLIEALSQELHGTKDFSTVVVNRVIRHIFGNISESRAVYYFGEDKLAPQIRALPNFKNGIFTIVALHNLYITATLETSNPKLATEQLHDTISHLSEFKARIVTLVTLPVAKIPFFPRYNVASELLRYQDVAEQVRKQYRKENATDDLSFIRKWYMDYLAERRTLAKEEPLMPAINPQLLKFYNVVIVINKSKTGMLIREYVSDAHEDNVLVLERDEISDKADLEGLNSPIDNSTLVHEISRASKNLDSLFFHPYVESLRYIAKQIREFNKVAKPVNMDVIKLTENQIEKWTKAEIDTKRDLILRLNIQHPWLRTWLLPLSIYIVFSFEPERPSWVRSGTIMESYIISNNMDDVISVRRETNETSISGTVYLSKFFTIADEKNRPILESRSDLLHYVRERTGDEEPSSLY